MINTNHPPDRRDDASGSWRSLVVICLCFVLSGLAALVYQTVWARKFALAFGTSELAIAAVLAAYMGGLALGAWLIERRITQVRRPLLWYANIEVGIAGAALILVPAGQWLVEWVLVALFGGQAAPPDAALGATSFFYLVAAFVVLLIPTTLMGATLPLLARYAVHSEAQIGGRIGLLYACNTGGAVAGALLGALVLLPSYGLSRTIWVAVAVNLAVAVLAYALNKSSLNFAADSPGAGQAAQTLPRERLRAGSSAAWVLPLMLVSGAVSFLHEVLWTRMLGHVLGSSIYAFGVMLASFLAGIALGGGLGALLSRRREGAARWLAISELAAAIAAVGAWYVLQTVSPAMDSLAQRVVFGFGLLFALAFAIGLTYPLAVRVLARSVAEAAPASARVYSWNTIGAIVGATAGGFLIIPALGYEGAVQLAVIASAVLAVFACYALFKPGKVFGLAISIPALVLALLFVPRPPELLLRYSPLQESGRGELLYYEVGRSAAVVTLRLGDLIEVRTNGLPEAAIDLRGTSPRLYPEAWMTPLAVLARPELENMLIVGFGGGRVVEAVPPSVQQVDVIELEDRVIEANRALTEVGLRDPLKDPLHDPRVNLIVNDARGTLQLTTRKYDAIISQPSHPWTAGASHLYTLEFMQQAREHLNPGGLFVQWMNIRFLDEDLLRSLVATLNAVYPEVRVYRPEPPTLLFLASDQPIEPERNLAATRAAYAAAADHYGGLGLNVIEDLVVGLVLDDTGSRAFAAEAEVIIDDTNRFAVASVHDFGRNISPDRLGDLLAPHDPLLQADSFIYRDLEGQLAFDYLARRIQAKIPLDASARRRLQELAGRFAGTDLQIYMQTLARVDDHYSSAAQQARIDDARLRVDSPLLRAAALEGRMVAMDFDSGPPIADPLSARDELVLRAVRLAAAGDWTGVASLDPQLGGIPWTSLWSNQAVRLRIEWRARQIFAGENPGAGAETIGMIDRLALVDPDPKLHLLRAMSAGDDPYVLTESLFRYALAILQGLVAADDIMRDEFAVLRQRFEQLRQDGRIYPYHYFEVQNVLIAAATR